MWHAYSIANMIQVVLEHIQEYTTFTRRSGLCPLIKRLVCIFPTYLNSIIYKIHKRGDLMYKVVPLTSTFLLTAIVGGIISGTYVYDYDKTWSFTLVLFFVLMFVSSLISLTYAKSPEDIR